MSRHSLQYKRTSKLLFSLCFLVLGALSPAMAAALPADEDGAVDFVRGRPRVRGSHAPARARSFPRQSRVVLRPTSATGRAAGDLDLCRKQAKPAYQHCLTALQDSDFLVQHSDFFVQSPDLFVQHPGLFVQSPDLFVEENLLWATHGFNLYRGDEKTEGRFPVFLKYAVARAQLVSWNTATQLTCDTINNEMSRFGFEGFAVREVREGEVALFSADDCKALYASLAPFLFLECPDDLITEVLVDKKIVKELVVKKTKQCMLWQAEQALHLQSQLRLQL